MGSSASRTAETARLIAAQSSTEIDPPSDRSAITCSLGLCPPDTRTLTMAKPMSSTVGAISLSMRPGNSMPATRSLATLDIRNPKK